MVRKRTGFVDEEKKMNYSRLVRRLVGGRENPNDRGRMAGVRGPALQCRHAGRMNWFGNRI
jgi:hypothetical protein